MGSEENNTELYKITTTQQVIASCCGAIVTSLLVTPLDVIKIRMQAQNNSFVNGKSFIYSNGLMDHVFVCDNGNSKAWYTKPGHFRGMWDAFMKIVKIEGIKSLWSGLPPTLIMALPGTVIYFTSYDQLSEVLISKLGKDSGHIPVLAGTISRLGSLTVVSPVELIRTKMQARRLSYKQLQICISNTIAKDGWFSLWRGWSATALRDVPFSALYWYNYERFKKKLCKKFDAREPTFVISFTSGAAAGSIAAAVTLPFDVVKTHRQTEIWSYETLNVSQKGSKSTWTTMKRIFAEYGFTGLFAGIVPRLIKVAPACAIMISTYEYGKSFFRKLNKQKNHKDKNSHSS
ncbi:mitochondrial glutathione transporter SLC25A40 [Pelodiscus sinensis]|uniref:mitochondrial glutathione transporter SLC25A40 n=1 Tax=Pelodiscus sinensis TaxID=13735 RepID=UPI000D71DEF1|nr:solute carrier family 25 member 40 isoform X1 [Pelodiscus sinensis]XP_025038604.1 solute carrier family 25 member 40 isoform X1 [Pelodiscus sinensis]XP_025038605.1 solute carrier family 25 member 40 isoform X1 [Pelodiscus sinensis]XP_025038606.1 solute carrier family 25 member 40 isoform X1 [Pelodiscus sinensis]|eukprot:XP_025038603.1 solute carrier family 25 member 40 isoform X1 [Pelodiscus sinensis]